MLSLCSAWMLTFKIYDDDTPPSEDLVTLGDICCYHPHAMLAIVIFVLLPLMNRLSPNIIGVTDLF